MSAYCFYDHEVQQALVEQDTAEALLREECQHPFDAQENYFGDSSVGRGVTGTVYVTCTDCGEEWQRHG